MRNKLKISSRSNPDFNGEWSQDDVENEMLELGIGVADENEWISYVIEHCIDGSIDESIEDVINQFISSNAIVEIALKLSDGTDIKISKVG